MKKNKWSLLRLIVSMANFILNLLRYYWEEKTKQFVAISIILIGIPIFVPLIAKNGTSIVPPTLPPKSDVNPEVPVKTNNELTSEKPEEIQKDAESGTQRTEKRDISEELKKIREGVESGTQRMEDMRRNVKAMNEDVQNMSERLKKLKERLDGEPEN